MRDTIRSATLIGYAELARSVGLDPHRLMRKCGLSPSSLSDPDARIDVGRMPHEDRDPLADWTDVAAWVDRNEDEFSPGAETGWLWIHAVSRKQ